MQIPKLQAFVAIMLATLIILGGAQLMIPPGLQIAEAQTAACTEVNKVENVNLAISVGYIPNPGAFPPELHLEIQRNLNDGPWTNPFPNLPPNTRSYVDSSVVQSNVDNKYTYRVRVINKDGPSGWSELGCKTILRQLKPPPTPVLVVS